MATKKRVKPTVSTRVKFRTKGGKLVSFVVSKKLGRKK